MFISHNPFRDTVFQPPDNRLNDNTVFPSDKTLRELELYSVVTYTNTPVEVSVNENTSMLSREINSANLNITDAVVRTGVTQSWLEKVISIVGDIKDMAEDAADTHLNPYNRDDVNTDAQTLLSQIDNYYLNAEFNGEKILQGTINTVSVNNGEDELLIHDANISRIFLGIDSIDLSTQSSAQTSVDALETAEDILNGQLALSQDEEEMLLSVYNVNYQTLDASQSSQLAQYTYQEALTLLENVKSSMSEKLNIGMVYNKGKIQDDRIDTILSSIKKLQEKLKTTQETNSEEEETTGSQVNSQSQTSQEISNTTATATTTTATGSATTTATTATATTTTATTTTNTANNH